MIYKRVYFLHLLCAAVTLLLLASCEKDEVNPPSIAEIRNYDAAPNDTVITTLNAGQWVVLRGKNLGEVTQVLFANTPATVNQTFLTNETIVVQVPSIPFETIPEDKVNIVTVISEDGSAYFTIQVTGPPILKYARNNGDPPADFVLEWVVANQEINLVGFNLENATSIAFQGVEADLSAVIYTDSSAIVTVPADLTESDASLVNTITYTTPYGTTSLPIRIIGPPIIVGVSYEMPREGDEVVIYGNNLFNLKSLMFAGTEITSFTEAEDGSWVAFLSPQLTQGGPVEITTEAGTFTTAYNVNDKVTGIVSDFEWGPNFRWDWWGGAELTTGDPNSGWPPYNADFDENSGMFLVLKNNVLNAGAGDEWGNAIRMSGVPWMPAENLSDPVGSWALKFEVSIPNKWEGGTLNIKTSNASYMVRMEPWKYSDSYKTNGWQTVAIPLSEFRSADGTASSVESLTTLLGSTGTSDMIFYMHNYGTSPTETGFYAAFDNFRVVRR